MRPRGGHRPLLPLALALALLTCARASRRGDPASCEPIEEGRTARVDLDRLAGTFEVRMVRDGNAASTAGSLTLRPPPGGDRTPWALIGSTDLDPTVIGGAVAGATESADPERPGVAVLADSTGIVIRLGSEANRRDRQAVDAAYAALFVAETSGQGFRGRWASGVEVRRAEGYFCATRVSDR